MEEQQVEGEVALADLERKLGADEAEVAAEFDEEVLEAVEQTAMQVELAVRFRQGEELDQVGVAEDVQGLRMNLAWSPAVTLLPDSARHARTARP